MRHQDLPWRVHELAHDFTLLDVWDVPLEPSAGKTFLDFHRLAASIGTDFGGATGFLMRVRGRMGRWFHWDDHNHTLPIPGCAETTVTARLTDEDRRRQRHDATPLPHGAVDDLRPVYLFENESLQELSNDTIHALLHLSWVPDAGRPTGRLAVYVKHRGARSRLYMALIKPFRHTIVYPSWIRHLQRAWQALAVVLLCLGLSCGDPVTLYFGLTVTTGGTGAGSVQSSPAGIDCGATCSAVYAQGSAIQLTATPAAGSTFTGWSGDCSGTGRTATTVVTAARTCTAGFAADLTLVVDSTGSGAGSVRSSPAGIDCGADCAARFAAGSTVTLTATPGADVNFTGWSGDCSGSATTTTVSMAAARSCTAAFDFPGAAPHLAFPQMPTHGQPPLPRLQLVTITFSGYPFQSDVEAFGDFVVGSHWLRAITRDFGDVPAIHLAKVNLPASMALSSYDAILLNNLGGLLPYPSDPAGLLYLFYQPAPCSTGGGYHARVFYGSTPVTYAVALNCGDARGAEGVASHEIGEVITDPYLNAEFFDASSAPWVGEVGDICNSYPWWLEGGFRFEPIWSNTAAAAGGSPCVPWVAGHPYVNVSPSPSTPQTVAAGGSAVFTLTGWSAATVPPWSLTVNTDNYAAQGFATTPQLDTTTIGNGTTATLTLHVPPGTQSGRSATVRVRSMLPDMIEGVGSFSADWSFQVIAQ